jgi:ketosteroid isomerase-like protein
MSKPAIARGQTLPAGALATAARPRPRRRPWRSPRGDVEPRALIEAWISAFARGDLDEARRLYADDGVLHAWHPPELAGDYRGLDEALRWFQRKSAWEGQAVTYGVEELLGGERHAATILQLSASGQEWRQVAVYRIEDGRIAEVWLYEEPRLSAG